MTRRLKTVLVMDDDESAAAFVRNALGPDGYRVMGAQDGLAGLRQAKKHRPDLIVLDICMPRHPGLYTLRDLKSDPETRDIPVIILTSVGKRLGVSVSTEELCRFLGIESMAFLEIPVDPAFLREMTERLLGNGAEGNNATASGA
jgi:CheY-like chemotaxis protein